VISPFPGQTSIPGRFDPFEIGRDSTSPVSPVYKDQGMFKFNGVIVRIVFELTEKQC
jgi:hypothetical protein